MSRTVLYIEDNAGNVSLVRRILARRPHIALHVAGNARDGVEAASSGDPALILLDNRLPDATGLDVLRQLVAAEATRGIPVIVMSGDSGRETVEEFLALGAAGFVEKPFDVHEFLALVDRLVP